jgi:hypothetical protein
MQNFMGITFTGRPVMRPNYEAFFSNYVACYNRALSGNLDVKSIRSFFAKKFLAAGPADVKTGKNGFLFSLVLRKGYDFYRKIGTKNLRVKRLTVTVIDYFHDMVKVQYNAIYNKKSGEKVSMDFEVTYFIQHPNQKPQIFGFVAGDEMKMYQEAGLI